MGIIQYVAFCVWLLSVNIMFSKFIHVVAFLMAKYSIVWIYYILFIHSSVDGHLGYFHFLAIISNAAMNICLQVFVWIYVFNSLWYTLKSRIAGSYGNSIFSFFKEPPYCSP